MDIVASTLTGFGICSIMLLILVWYIEPTFEEVDTRSIKGYCEEAASKAGLNSIHAIGIELSLKHAGFTRWDRYRWQEIEDIVQQKIAEFKANEPVGN